MIQNVNSRTHNGNARGHNVRNSVSHARGISVSTSFRNGASGSSASPLTAAPAATTPLTVNPSAGVPVSAIPERTTSPRDRDQPSPTLPSLPSHPTLNALISSSLGGDVAAPDPTLSDPAVLAAQPAEHVAPRIGDPGKRMLGAALGVRHPALGPRVISGANGNGMGEVQRAMGGLVVAE